MTKKPRPTYRSSFPFALGTYTELSEIEYVGYNLEGLLYDAAQGLHISRRMIFEHFCERTLRGDSVPQPIQQFCAHQFRPLVKEEITREQLLAPLGNKPKGIAPPDEELVALSRGETPILEAFESLSEQLGKGKPKISRRGISPKALELRYYMQKRRRERIANVETILKRFYTKHTLADGERWHNELKALYKHKETFDLLS